MGDANPNDYIFFQLSSERLQDPIVIPMMTVNDFELDILTQKIEKVTQSNEEFLMDGVFDLMVSVVEDPQSVDSGNLESWLKKKRKTR